MRLRFVIIGLITMLVLSSCALRSVTEPRRVDPEGEPTPVPTAVSVASAKYTVESGDIVREITLSGIIVPVTQIDLSFAKEGQVAIINAGPGDVILEGDVLAELDISALDSALILANSALAVAQSQLNAAQTTQANNQRRAEIAVEKLQLTLVTLIENSDDPPTADQALQIQLLELDLELAQINFSELETGIDAALGANVAQAQLRVDELVAQLNASLLVAPSDGTILRATIRNDQQVTPSDVVFIIADVSNLELRALATEEDLALMIEGMVGISERAGRPGPEVEAVLSIIPLEYGGTGTEDSIVRFTLENQGSDYAVSDRATITLLIGSVDNVVWLPPQAIREFRGRQFVVVEEGEGQRRVDIETGLASNDRVEIISGLEAGQTVVGE